MDAYHTEWAPTFWAVSGFDGASGLVPGLGELGFTLAEQQEAASCREKSAIPWRGGERALAGFTQRAMLGCIRGTPMFVNNGMVRIS